MGNSASAPVIAQQHQALLDRLAGPDSIAVGDPFWKQLLTFNAPLTKFEPHALQRSLQPFLERLGADPPHHPIQYRRVFQ